jgi:hypothetical protein
MGSISGTGRGTMRAGRNHLIKNLDIRRNYMFYMYYFVGTTVTVNVISDPFGGNTFSFPVINP